MCIIPGHGDVVSSCVAHPTRTSRAASASADGVVKVWDLQGKKCVKTLSGGHGGRYVRGIAFNPSGSRLISGKSSFFSQDFKYYSYPETTVRSTKNNISST